MRTRAAIAFLLVCCAAAARAQEPPPATPAELAEAPATAPAVPPTVPAAPPADEATGPAARAAVRLSLSAAAALPPATPEQAAARRFAGVAARAEESKAVGPKPTAGTAAAAGAPAAPALLPGVAGGRIGGLPFRVDSATLSGLTLTLRQGRGWQADKDVAIFFFGRRIPVLGRDFVESPKSARADQFAPHISVGWTPPAAVAPRPGVAYAAPPRRTRVVNEGYSLHLRYDSLQDGVLRGRIDLRLPGGDYVSGPFTAEVR